MSVDEAIRFGAHVSKVQTMVDGGIRLTLDLNPTESEMIVALINAKRPGILLECACLAVKVNKNEW